MQFVLVLGILSALQGVVEKKFYLDYSSGERESNLEVDKKEAVFNPQDNQSIVLFRPGSSEITAKFRAPAKPQKAVLEIEHLSAGANVKYGGTSCITILINGEPLVKEWEVGSHSYVADRLHITKMLQQGENTVQIRSHSGQTTYWMKRFEIACVFPPGTEFGAKVKRIEGNGNYVVVVSRSTRENLEWNKVVEALRKKHEATVLVHPGSVADVKDELKEVFSKYVCFVARPEEVGREYVIRVHRMTRQLDDDPYTDTIWGILTGFEANDALRIAEYNEPLAIRTAAAGCGLDLTNFESGVRYSETEKNAMWEKKKGELPQKARCPDDTTKAIVDLLNVYKPELFVTSGHATHRDWQIGYSYKNGQFRCKDGQLYGIDLQGRRYEIHSDNPKVYIGAGNCLMGLIEDKQTMALAWMRSGGVHQLIGYVVSTWYGYGGWGVNEIFLRQQGRFTFAESFYLNNQALVHRLESEFPESARVNFQQWHIETDRQLVNKLARKHRIQSRDAVGLLWDRDTVAFYGDPAWEARLVEVKTKPWSQEFEEKDGVYSFRVETLEDGSWQRSPMAFLPHRVQGVDITVGKKLNPLVTDNFILVPLTGEFKKGELYSVVFRASPARD